MRSTDPASELIGVMEASGGENNGAELGSSPGKNGSEMFCSCGFGNAHNYPSQHRFQSSSEVSSDLRF